MIISRLASFFSNKLLQVSSTNHFPQEATLSRHSPVVCSLKTCLNPLQTHPGPENQDKPSIYGFCYHLESRAIQHLWFCNLIIEDHLLLLLLLKITWGNNWRTLCCCSVGVFRKAWIKTRNKKVNVWNVSRRSYFLLCTIDWLQKVPESEAQWNISTAKIKRNDQWTHQKVRNLLHLMFQLLQKGLRAVYSRYTIKQNQTKNNRWI